MTYDWYKIINRAEFEATGLPSRTVEVVLSGIGLKEVLVTKGNFFSLTYDGIMLSLSMGGKNPFPFDDMAVYEDPAGDVWLGFLISEDEE
jgi:hypothetical protein